MIYEDFTNYKERDPNVHTVWCDHCNDLVSVSVPVDLFEGDHIVTRYYCLICYDRGVFIESNDITRNSRIAWAKRQRFLGEIEFSRTRALEEAME